MSNVPSLGCRISLISKSEIRYEGILYTLDTKESTVALAKVRSFGTEGRPTDRPVAPRDEVYEYIIFRVSDIKDLQVLDVTKAHGLPPDPAIVQHSQPVSSHFSSLSLSQPFNALYGLPSFQHFPSQAGYSQMSSLLGSSHYSGSTRSTLQRKSPTSDAGVQVSGNVDFDLRGRESREPLKPRNRDSSQQPNYQNRRRVSSVNRQQNARRNVSRRGRSRPSGSQNIEKFENEYDFEQANAEFQELENKLSKSSLEDANATSEQTTDDPPGAYDKEKSFFDDISCEATQRSKGFPRFDWRYERKLNVETFGVSASNAWLRRRRGRGGFRRGFRGRGGVNRTSDAPVQKTVTFDETPAIKEVEVVELEVKPDPIPVIEVISEKKSDWPEPSDPKAEAQWN